MKPHVRRAVRAYLALALFYLVNNLSLSTAQDDCLPDIGGSGDLKSVVLNIQTWEHRSSNFHVSMNYCNSILQLFTPSKIQEKPQFCLVKCCKTKKSHSAKVLVVCHLFTSTSTDEEVSFRSVTSSPIFRFLFTQTSIGNPKLRLEFLLVSSPNF